MNLVYAILFFPIKNCIMFSRVDRGRASARSPLDLAAGIGVTKPLHHTIRRPIVVLTKL